MRTISAANIKLSTIMSGWNRTVIVTGTGTERVWNEFDALRSDISGWDIKHGGKVIANAKTLKAVKAVIAETVNAA